MNAKSILKGDIMQTATTYVLALGLSGLVLGAFVLANYSFLTSLSPGSATGAVANNVSLGLIAFSGQFGNMGTMAGVGILLLFVFAAIGSIGGLMARE